jgi:hypothetical protein
MSRLKRLTHQIHRRSLWQVLGIDLVGARVTFQGIEALAKAGSSAILCVSRESRDVWCHSNS